jgi:hypothetical protein
LPERQSSETKVAEAYCWAITNWWGGRGAAYQVPVCWGLDFNWTPLYIHTQLAACILNSDLRRNLWNVNWCVSPEVSE